MCVRGLQTLLTAALTDRCHREDLLHANPAAYAGFDLSPTEITHLRALEAQTLEDFAQQAHRLFYGEELTLEGAMLPVDRVPGQSAWDYA